LNLPDGSGLDLLKEIRGNGRHPVPVLVLTGAATPDNFRESFLLEADQVNRKPVPAATLLALIRRLVVSGYPARWAFTPDDVLRLRPISFLTHLMER
jgi:DNA-binding response OmpR family regulator